jgi:hypothetical protein
MLEIALFVIYLSRKPTRLGRLWAFAIVVNDVFSLVAVNSSAWMYLIEFPAGRMMQTWCFPLITVSKSISGFLEHVFLINWFYALSKSIILTVILGLLALSHVACHLTAAAYSFKSPSLPMPGWNTVRAVLITSAFILAAMVDVLVAAGLAWNLLQLRTVVTGIKSIFHRFLICIVVSGAFTALFGVIFLILYWTSSPSCLAFIVIMGRIYGITVFANLVFVQGMQGSSTRTHTADLQSSLWSSSFSRNVDSRSEKLTELELRSIN